MRRPCGQQADERVGRHPVAVDDRRVHARPVRHGDLHEADRAVGGLPLVGRAERAAVGLDVERHDPRGRHALAQPVERRRDRRRARSAPPRGRAAGPTGGRGGATAMRLRGDGQARVRLDALQPGVDERDLELAGRAGLDGRPVARRAERGLDDDARRVRLEGRRDLEVEPRQLRHPPGEPGAVRRRRPQPQRRVRAARRPVQDPQRDAPPGDAAPARGALAQQHAAVGHGRHHRAGARLHGERGEGAVRRRRAPSHGGDGAGRSPVAAALARRRWRRSRARARAAVPGRCGRAARRSRGRGRGPRGPRTPRAPSSAPRRPPPRPAAPRSPRRRPR